MWTIWPCVGYVWTQYTLRGNSIQMIDLHETNYMGCINNPIVHLGKISGWSNNILMYFTSYNFIGDILKSYWTT